MSFRKILIAEARRRGLSAYAAAKLAGLKLRTVQDYFAGGSDMAGERVAALAAALGLELRAVKRSAAQKGKR